MRKSERYAWVGTVVTLISVGLIMFFVIMPSIEKTEEGGIMISFGNADDGAGLIRIRQLQRKLLRSRNQSKKKIY